MPYRSNPFLERMSERTTSDQEFVRLFSPKILERLAEGAFEGAVHIFRSPPGGGKTTLLRAFTPTALQAFWNARRSQDMTEAYQRLLAREVLHAEAGPQLLGVFLSCASGYADLPPGLSISQEGLFRALLDCRIVLRSLRSLATLLGFATPEQLALVRLDYAAPASELKSIPLQTSARSLLEWAEEYERRVYAQLDALTGTETAQVPAHVRLEGPLWLQGVRFMMGTQEVAPRRLLMIDDLHKLRRKQRAMLIDELVAIRPTIPVWLAERNIALGDLLLSQGAREGRDLRDYSLEEMWNAPRGQYQFVNFAQNILDRRLDLQDVIPAGAFSQYLRWQFKPDELSDEIRAGFSAFREHSARFESKTRYSQWMLDAEHHLARTSVDSVRELNVLRILVARDESRRQLNLDLVPLPTDEINERDSPQVQGAAEIFAHDEVGIPYYFGIDRICVLATNNVEELLSIAAALYDALQAKQVLRKPELLLSPKEQEKLIREVAKRKRDFIPKNHTEGTRAQRLLDAIGQYCRDRTFLPNAPYAPGVTGVRLAQTELDRVGGHQSIDEHFAPLRRVLAECVAENLLVARQSAASGSRDSGTVFYLNRTLCTLYGLPLQMGGWQDVGCNQLLEWIEPGRRSGRPRRLEMG